MPRGPVVYSPPAGTVPQLPLTTILSATFNSFVNDVTNTFNTVQPIAYGGNGVTDNKPLTNSFGLKDSTDLTKILAFDISGYSTGTIRTVAWPDGSGTVMFTNSVLANAQALPGSVVNSGYVEQKSYFGSSSIIPVDDTVPTSTEGDSILSFSFTPKASGNKVRIRSALQCTRADVGTVIMALHNGGATAIASTFGYIPGAGLGITMYVESQYTLASTAVQTVSVRIGPGGSGVMYINGNQAQRYFGGSVGATLSVEEIKA